MNRIVRGGISYIDDVPVNKSVFGKDPFEPVTVSFVKDLFRSDFDGVRIFDAETNEDMNDISQRMLLNGPVKAVAGCAGLASFYAAKCRFGKNSHNGSLPEAGIHIRPPFLICCGSLNTVSVAQIKAAASEGWPVAPLPKKSENDSPEFKNIQSNLLYENICIVESFSTPEGKKEDIAERFGNMICKAADSGLIGTLIVIGGDTLFSAVKKLDASAIRIVDTLADGAVLSETVTNRRVLPIISKSGGFGGRTWLTDIIKEMKK